MRAKTTKEFYWGGCILKKVRTNFNKLVYLTFFLVTYKLFIFVLQGYSNGPQGLGRGAPPRLP